MEVKVLPSGYQLLKCEDLSVGCIHGGAITNMNNGKLEVYVPANYLVYVEQGILELEYENTVYTVSKGSFFLVRKYTSLTMKAKPGKDGEPLRKIKFALYDSYIRKVIADIDFTDDLTPVKQRIVPIEDTSGLMDVIISVQQQFHQIQQLQPTELLSMVEKALKGIIASNPQLAIVFKEYTRHERADLIKFLEGNFLMPVSLKELATLSGRSLSTFNREVKMILGRTPRQWILRKRLYFAHSLILSTDMSISDIAFESGFQALEHFSRSFKKEFGTAPSVLKIQSVN